MSTWGLLGLGAWIVAMEVTVVGAMIWWERNGVDTADRDGEQRRTGERQGAPTHASSDSTLRVERNRPSRRVTSLNTPIGPPPVPGLAHLLSVLRSETAKVTSGTSQRVDHEGASTCLLYTSPSPRD